MVECRFRRTVCPTWARRQDGATLQEDHMAWVYLIVAGILEIIWASAMKQSDGFTRAVPAVITVVTMIGSFVLLSISMRTLPLGTAYTIWTGIGAVGAFVVGIAVLGESINPMRVLAAVLIVSGLVLMKVSTPD
jgi:quaternary ammonium compound-resistance protein SugE